jgi:hypothetical protein
MLKYKNAPIAPTILFPFSTSGGPWAGNHWSNQILIPKAEAYPTPR